MNSVLDEVICIYVFVHRDYGAIGLDEENCENWKKVMDKSLNFASSFLTENNEVGIKEN